ncbi:MAG: AMP-binding protein [Terriglobales bacterium]|jgi:acyl-coenzyme A synthetase/AMP-(fatty) acid ligase
MIFSIDDNARRNHVALIDGDASWTYDKLSDEVAWRREALAGSEKRLLFLFCRNDLSSVAWYLAAVEAGQSVALMNDQLDAQLAANLISLYRPEWVLGSAPVDSDEYESPNAAGFWRRQRMDGGPIHPELALMLSTSGSTGSPKFVRLKRGNVESNADSIRQALSISESDVPVAHLPIHYSYGLSVINSHLLAGATIVLAREGLVSPAFWESIRRHDVDSFSGVPYTYQMLRRLGLDKVNAPKLRIMTQAGGKLDTGNIAHFHQCMTERQGRFFVMYGQTEATARISILPSTDLPRKLGSAGRPVPGGAIRIHHEQEAPVGVPDIEGELVYTGPNVMLGYATQREDLTKGDELGGCLFTGDRARIDAEGYVFILGRSKRDAKLFGLRVNLDELEAFVKRNGPAAAVASSNRVVIFCEFGSEAAHSEIRAALAAELRIHHSAFEFRRVDKLPTKDTGKINYEDLLARV